jgi:hypothetical protein
MKMRVCASEVVQVAVHGRTSNGWWVVHCAHVLNRCVHDKSCSILRDNPLKKQSGFGAPFASRQNRHGAKMMQLDCQSNQELQRVIKHLEGGNNGEGYK